MHAIKSYTAIKNSKVAGCWWFTPIILATWEADIGRIAVSGQPRQIVHDTSISKITRVKIDWR
jgi:hypothetical protein